ncbi:uncharacterized protein [Hoplias malabaricus]|uniref:uncharacterized protein n=1 Tax=Hoplias malabaricus TaxID=27720 RepID=UPI003462EFA0
MLAGYISSISLKDKSNEDNLKTHRTKITMELKNKAIHTAQSRAYRVTAVYLGLMGVLLLPAVSTMPGPLAEKDELKILNNNPKIEEDRSQQLKTSYDSLMIERDQLKTSYASLKIEKDQLQTNYNNLLTEKDQLELKLKQVTEENVKLEAKYTTLKDLFQLLQKVKSGFQEKDSNSGCFRIGDRVKVKASVSSPKHGWGDASHKSVGVVTALDDEDMTVDFPEHKSWNGIVSEMELASSSDEGYFRTGDRVRVKTSVSSPKYEWGDASHKSVGEVTAVDGEKIIVDFPEHKSWKAAASEMELAPSTDAGHFRIGDKVRVKASVSSPKHGWGHASHKSVGVVKEINGEKMTVDFPEHKSWSAAASEMELAPSASEYFRIGDRVQVKASVSSPKYEWGSVSHKSVGVVTAIKDEEIIVDFPEQTSWNGAASEMELAPSAEHFRIGDRVRVKASVSTPKFQWGEASHISVGVVTVLNGEKMTVDFPEHKSWKGIVSEMELLPSPAFCRLKVGDKVHVKASVKDPNYGWGSVSHKSVGEIKALKMTVDFPEQSGWIAEPSEMELDSTPFYHI